MLLKGMTWKRRDYSELVTFPNLEMQQPTGTPEPVKGFVGVIETLNVLFFSTDLGSLSKFNMADFPLACHQNIKNNNNNDNNKSKQNLRCFNGFFTFRFGTKDVFWTPSFGAGMPFHWKVLNWLLILLLGLVASWCERKVSRFGANGVSKIPP